MARVLRPFTSADTEATAAADALIARFGSPARALCATDIALRDALPGQALAEVIVAARALVQFGHSTVMTNERLDAQSQPFLRYLAATLGFEEREVLLAVFLDADGRYLADERMGAGDISSFEVRLRPLASRAFELGAHSLLLAHNHPSGDANPSGADLRATERLADILSLLEVRLIDHLVVCRGSVFSISLDAMVWSER